MPRRTMNRLLCRAALITAAVTTPEIVSAGLLRGMMRLATPTIEVPSSTIVIEEPLVGALHKDVMDNSTSTFEEDEQDYTADYPSEVPPEEDYRNEEPSLSEESSHLVVEEHSVFSESISLDRLQMAIEEDSTGIHAKDVNGWTLLHEAARAGHLPVCQYLLDMGSDINAVTNVGASVLYTAVRHHGNDSPIALYLQSRGAILKEPRPHALPAEVAAMSIEELIHARFPQILAAEGRVEDLKNLVHVKEPHLLQPDISITHSVLLTSTDELGWTALHEATRYGEIAMMRYLILEGKVDMNAQTLHGASARYLARILHEQGSGVEEFLASQGAQILGPPHALFNATGTHVA